jgi:hypothetical protein
MTNLFVTARTRIPFPVRSMMMGVSLAFGLIVSITVMYAIITQYSIHF